VTYAYIADMQAVACQNAALPNYACTFNWAPLLVTCLAGYAKFTTDHRHLLTVE
jgi:hypothetical protein